MATYTIDAAMSRFTVRAFAGGMLSALGHDPILGIREFSGEVRLDPAALEQASLSLRIRADSLEVQNDASDKDKREMKRVMDEEALEVARYPEILYETSRVTGTATGARFRLDLQGSLTLHGVTRPQNVLAQVLLMGGMLRAFGDFTILQTDYRIKLASVAGGALKLKDELKFSFEMLATREAKASLGA